MPPPMTPGTYLRAHCEATRWAGTAGCASWLLWLSGPGAAFDRRRRPASQRYRGQLMKRRPRRGAVVRGVSFTPRRHKLRYISAVSRSVTRHHNCANSNHPTTSLLPCPVPCPCKPCPYAHAQTQPQPPRRERREGNSAAAELHPRTGSKPRCVPDRPQRDPGRHPRFLFLISDHLPSISARRGFQQRRCDCDLSNRASAPPLVLHAVVPRRASPKAWRRDVSTRHPVASSTSALYRHDVQNPTRQDDPLSPIATAASPQHSPLEAFGADNTKFAARRETLSSSRKRTEATCRGQIRRMYKNTSSPQSCMYSFSQAFHRLQLSVLRYASSSAPGRIEHC
ncbi:hypothetical protein BDV95DRAFT_644740 [Massariosphaeria phaeospora]|uniref:Uncharacterized protein n=1 Tax=Massariosphaeria phaeospora TaxID=100035 RepID=A0A7C8IEN4_9PLEO|nr:hypothetical protein BDV95DRAFT_644740 [Massariosphaeria phaeospora]